MAFTLILTVRLTVVISEPWSSEMLCKFPIMNCCTILVAIHCGCPNTSSSTSHTPITVNGYLNKAFYNS